MTDNLSMEAEAERLKTPVQSPGSLWRYLWNKNPYVYYNVPAIFLAEVVELVYFPGVWWAASVVGIMLGLVAWNTSQTIENWRWRRRVAREANAWVERVTTGARPFPRDLAWALWNLIQEGRQNVAMMLALEWTTREK